MFIHLSVSVIYISFIVTWHIYNMNNDNGCVSGAPWNILSSCTLEIYIYIVYTFVLIFDTYLRIYTGGMQIGVNKMDVFPLGYSFVFFVYVEHVFGHSCAFLLISGGRLRYPYPIPINFISEKILIYIYIYIMSPPPHIIWQ